MPGMNGMDLFREVSRLKPELALNFVFSTGDTVAAETREFLERAGKPWVEKPFDVDKVADLLEEVLAGRT
jgi:DNA-binding NtrC family response regulator